MAINYRLDEAAEVAENARIEAEKRREYDPDTGPDKFEVVPERNQYADPMAIVKRDFAPYLAEIDRMTKESAAVVVKDEATNIQAVEMAGQAKRIGKNVEDKRKSTIKEAQSFVKSVNNFCKTFTGPLDTIETRLKRGISAYAWKKEQLRQEAERKARIEADKLRARLEAQAAKEQARAEKQAEKRGEEAPAPIAAIIVPDPVMPRAETVTRTESGNASMVMKWTWVREAKDIKEIPGEFLVIDTVKVNQAIRGGVRNIAGIKIYQEATTQIRM